MNLNSWDFYDIEKEISNSNVAELLELYKREDKKYGEKALELVTNSSKFTEEGKKEFADECEFIDKCKTLIALALAERLTK